MESQDQGSTEPRPQGTAWRPLLADQWEALRRRALGIDPKASRKLSELGQECQSLAAIAAWYEAKCNITHAAERLGTSRRALRDRIDNWLKDNPTPLAVEVRRKRPPKWEDERKPQSEREDS